MITVVKILLEISDIKHFGMMQVQVSQRVHHDIQHFGRIMRSVFFRVGVNRLDYYKGKEFMSRVVVKLLIRFLIHLQQKM